MHPGRAALDRRWTAEGHYDGRSIRDAIEAGAERYAAKRFVVWSPTGVTETSLGEVRGRGLRLAGALSDLGLRRGDVVAMQMPNWVESAVLYHACVELGLVVLPIPHVHDASEVDPILRSSGAKLVVTPAEWNDISFADRAYSDRHPGLRWVVVGEAPDHALPFATLEARGQGAYGKPELDPDGVHVLSYGSVTTAAARGVMHGHRSLLHENAALQRATRDEPGREVMVSPDPVGHIEGLLANLLFPVLRGQDIVMMDGWDPGACLELLDHYGATRSGGAPFYLSSLLDHPDLTRRDLSRLRVFGCGGAGAAPGLIERAEEAGLVSFRAYGTAEHPSISCGGIDDPLELRAYTDGRPMHGVELRIVDPEGRELPAGEPGEILSRGPDMCIGYRDPEHDVAFTDDGWLRSGDIGVVDERGGLTVATRTEER